jgi:hypothetical protein
MTKDEVTVANFSYGWVINLTDCPDLLRTSVLEGTSNVAPSHVGIAARPDSTPLRQRIIHYRNSRQQHLCIRVVGGGEHLINTPHLAKRSQVHNPYSVRDMGNHGEIMSNEQIR